jgi:hypothetical protein
MMRWDYEDGTYRDTVTGEEIPMSEWPDGS